MKGLDAILMLFLAILAALYKAFVFTFLWVWFIVPLGVPELSFMWAAGVILTIQLLTKKYKKDDDTELDLEKFIYSITILSIAWGFGWIFQLFM